MFFFFLALRSTNAMKAIGTWLLNFAAKIEGVVSSDDDQQTDIARESTSVVSICKEIKYVFMSTCNWLFIRGCPCFQLPLSVRQIIHDSPWLYFIYNKVLHVQVRFVA